MTWTTPQIIASAVSILALLIGIANFVIARVSARKDAARRKRDDLLLIDQLLDDVYNDLWGKNGYSSTRDRRKLENAEIRLRKAMKIDPQHPRGTEYEGHLFEFQGNMDMAKQRYNRSIALDGTRARPHNCLGPNCKGRGSDRTFQECN